MIEKSKNSEEIHKHVKLFLDSWFTAVDGWTVQRRGSTKAWKRKGAARYLKNPISQKKLREIGKILSEINPEVGPVPTPSERQETEDKLRDALERAAILLSENGTNKNCVE